MGSLLLLLVAVVNVFGIINYVCWVSASRILCLHPVLLAQSKSQPKNRNVQEGNKKLSLKLCDLYLYSLWFRWVELETSIPPLCWIHLTFMFHIKIIVMSVIIMGYKHEKGKLELVFISHTNNTFSGICISSLSCPVDSTSFEIFDE